MQTFIEENSKSFNNSQLNILKRVQDLPKNEIMLIQGPPGTGKTFTITSIISMVLKAGARKVHVCAHSNTAVDEICKRLSTTGLQLFTTDEATIKSMLLRIGNLKYELHPNVQKHTLDTKVNEQMFKKQISELTKNIR